MILIAIKGARLSLYGHASVCVTYISQLLSLVCSHLAVVTAVVVVVAACRFSWPCYCYCSCCCCCCRCSASAASINLCPAFWHLSDSESVSVSLSFSFFGSVCLPCLWAIHLSVVGFILYLFRAVVVFFFGQKYEPPSGCVCVTVCVCVCICLDILSILFALLLLILVLPTYPPSLLLPPLVPSY